MPYVRYSGPTLGSNAAFLQDEASREHIMAVGAMLHAPDFALDANGDRYVASGTLVGRTRAEKIAGRGFGPFAAGDEEVFLLARSVDNADDNADCTLVRHGALILVSALPASVTGTPANLAEVRARYQEAV